MKALSLNRTRWVIVGALSLALLASHNSFADLCARWSASRAIGTVDSRALREASGVVFSRTFPDRLYLHNDSGSGSEFFVTSVKGVVQQKVSLGNGIRFDDVEDIALGPCGAQKTCVYLGDIGDNSERRRFISVIAVEERDQFPAVTSPLAVVHLTYPDGAHNAEALGVDASGNIYVITKESSGHSVVYRWAVGTTKMEGTITGKLVPVGDLQMTAPKSLRSAAMMSGSFSRVTGMDIASHGRSFVVLTYGSFMEVNMNLEQTSSFRFDRLLEGRDYRIVPTQPTLDQQEAIAYTPDAKSIVYLSEVQSRASPIEAMSCEQ